MKITKEDMDSFLKPEKGWIRNISGYEYVYDFHLKHLPVIIKVLSSIPIDEKGKRNKGAENIRVFSVLKDGMGKEDKILEGLVNSMIVYVNQNWRTNLQKAVYATINRSRIVASKRLAR